MARNQAIVLKKTPFREHDELLMCYTKEEGKQRYLAKSSSLASSKQGHHMDVLNLIEFSVVQGRISHIITSARCLNAFPLVKSSLQSLARTFFVLECFDKLVYEGEKDEKLWNFLFDVLDNPREWSAYADIASELIATLGYPRAMPLRDLTTSSFASLQFMKKL